MWHDEPANRPGQDPNGSMPFDQWDSHFRRQVAHYGALVERYPTVHGFADQLTKYQFWLSDHLATTATSAEADELLPF